MRAHCPALVLLCLLAPTVAVAQDLPLAPSALPALHTASPDETFRTFMGAMEDYRQGVLAHNDGLTTRLEDAVYCLDTSTLTGEARPEQARMAARYLKEVLDRILIADQVVIPASRGADGRWRILDTAITISPLSEGARAGDFLFSAETVRAARSLYERVRALPYKVVTGAGAHLVFEEARIATESDAGSLLLRPTKTENPRDTMDTFLRAMNDYVEGVATNNPDKESRIQDAMQCLDLSEIPAPVREIKGHEAAQLIKEVMDRVVKIDLDRIPTQGPGGGPIENWRLKNSDITIARLDEGERAGDYLFTAQTVRMARHYYDLVEDLPYKAGGGAGFKRPWLEANVPEWSRDRTVLLANWQWIGLAVLILLGWILKALVTWLVSLARRLAEKRSSTEWDDKLFAAVERPAGLLTAATLWYFSVHALQLDETSLTILTGLIEVVFCVGVIQGLYRLSDVLTLYLGSLAKKTDSNLDDHLVPVLQRALHTFIIVFGVLIIVQNLGFNVMSVLAGLGLGGLAFALAAQDTCANLFGSIMILLDRPFQVGDWIVADGVEGSVESIGFRSTQVRTFYQSVISVPNSGLAKANIDNMGARKERRVKAFFGLTYDTPPEKIEAFMEGLKNIVKANKTTRKDYFQVAFTGYGDSSLQIMLYCFLDVPDWSTELLERQNIYLEILRLADHLGVDFAFPTQTLNVETFPEKPPYTSHKESSAEQVRLKAAAFGPGGASARPDGLGIFTPGFKEEDEPDPLTGVTTKSDRQTKAIKRGGRRRGRVAASLVALQLGELGPRDASPRVLRRELQETLQISDRARGLAQVAARQAPHEPRLGALDAEVERARGVVRRSPPLLLLEPNRGPSRPGGQVLVVERQGAVEVCDRAGRIAVPHARHGQPGPQVRAIGIELNRALGGADRSGEVTAREPCAAEVAPGRRVIGPQLEHALVVCDGPGEIARDTARPRPRDPDGWVARTEGDRSIVVRDRLANATHSAQDNRTVAPVGRDLLVDPKRLGQVRVGAPDRPWPGASSSRASPTSAPPSARVRSRGRNP